MRSVPDDINETREALEPDYLELRGRVHLLFRYRRFVSLENLFHCVNLVRFGTVPNFAWRSHEFQKSQLVSHGRS